MRVLLVDPPVAWRAGAPEPGHTLPLGLGLLAAVLRAHGHEPAIHVAGVDPWDGADSAAALGAALAAHAPDVVGIGAATATWPTARRAARLVREQRPAATVVLGGPHPTLRAAQVLAEPAVAVVVRGEAEETLPALLAALALHPTEPGAAAPPAAGGARAAAFGRIPGLAWRAADGTPRLSAPAPLVADLDALPAPAHDALLWAERAHRAAFAGVLTARGCPFHCSYCAASALGGRRLRRRDPARVAAEVAGLMATRGVDYLFFHDSVFTAHPGHLDAVLTAIGAAVGRVPFACQTRTDCVDPAIARRLAAGGCHRVMLGIESGVPETLRRIHKRPDLDEPRRAVRLLRAAGLAVSGFFMVGFPWERAADMEQTAAYALALDLDAVHLFAATPLPGAALAAETGDPELPEGHDFRGPALNLTALPDEEWRALFGRCARRFDAYNQERSRQERSRSALTPPGTPA